MRNPFREIFRDLGRDGKKMASHGANELAASLFSPSNSYVQHGPAMAPTTPEAVKNAQHLSAERGGRGD